MGRHPYGPTPMSDPPKPSDPKAPGPCRSEAVKARQIPAKPGKPTREERLAKALRENLKRRKARTTKD